MPQSRCGGDGGLGLGWVWAGSLRQGDRASPSLLVAQQFHPARTHSPLDLSNYSEGEERRLSRCLSSCQQDELALSQRQRHGNSAGDRE